MNDYTKTPSFFNNSEILKKYLGDTSYYNALRYAVKKIICLTRPKTVVELGAATGATTFMLAETFKNIQFHGSDIRSDVIEQAQGETINRNISNVSFSVCDMCDFVEQPIYADLIFLLYSFHHIPDPLRIKEKFISDIYENIAPKSYVCIAETFIPEEANGLEDTETILNLWAERAKEGGASTYWHSLSGLGEDEIELARETAEYCANNEIIAGELVAKRRDEFLVKRSWLCNQCKKRDFEIVIDKPVNALGDGVILLRKPT